MKVLLIQPNRELPLAASSIHMERPTLPLGLLYLASAIRKNHEVRILDCLMDKNTRISRKGNILFHGLEWEHIQRQIEDFNPDVIGLTILFTAQESAAGKILARISNHFPDIKIILGGCAPSMNYEKYLKKNVFAIIGEGEASLPLLLERFQNPRIKISEIPNLAYVHKRELKYNPQKITENLDQIRLPAYDLIDMEKYLSKGRRSISMLTSRGCPFSCIFCSVRSHFGHRLRMHSAEYIFKHIEFLAKKYSINHIRFEDDCFTLDARRLRVMLRLLKRIQVDWEANLGPVSGSFDKRLLPKMKRAGCTKLFFALESGNEGIRNRVLGRNLDISKAENLLEACKEIGISTAAFFITGFPFETKEQKAETLSLARHLKNSYETEPMISCLPGN